MKKKILSAIGLLAVLCVSAQESGPDGRVPAVSAETVSAFASEHHPALVRSELSAPETDSAVCMAEGAVSGAVAGSATEATVRETAGADSVLFGAVAQTAPAFAAENVAFSATGTARSVSDGVEPAPMRKPSRHFLPMRRRIDREISRGRFAYKGELILGLTASYGTMSSDDTDFMVILDNIDLDGTIATVKPFIGYFYRDNRCVGVRFGYEHMSGHLGNVDLDLGEQNDISLNIAGMSLDNDNYSFALFHRSYVGLDQKGRFGLFAEVEASAVIGSGNFINNSGDTPKATYSDNLKLKLAFNPGVAVYIFPNVCATVSLGLGGIQYNSVTQRDAEGNKTGSRSASKMRFRLNIADINFGMVIHFWDKSKR